MSKSLYLFLLILVGCSTPLMQVPPEEVIEIRKVEWHSFSMATVKLARQENKTILAYIEKSNCKMCKLMNSLTFSNPCVTEVLERDYISIKIDADKQPEFAAALMDEDIYPNTNWALPTGQILPITAYGFFPPIEYCQMLKTIRKKSLNVQIDSAASYNFPESLSP